MRTNKQRTVILLASSTLLLTVAGGAYYWYFMRPQGSAQDRAQGRTTSTNMLPDFLRPTASPPARTLEDFAREHGINPRLLRAFIQIESGSLPPVGQYGPVIRLEAHTLLREDPRVGNYFKAGPVEPWVGATWRPTGQGPWLTLHTGGQRQQYEALNLARSLLGPSSDAPYQAISMGKGQVMGFHHRMLGYPTAKAMFEAARSESAQDVQFLTFLENDPGMFPAMKAGNMREMVRIYNGPGQVDHYLAKFQQALRAYA